MGRAGVVRIVFGLLATAKMLTWAQTADTGDEKSSEHMPSRSIFSADFSADQDRVQLPAGEDPDNQLILPFAKHLMADQEHLWSLPHHLRLNDVAWIAPLAGTTAAFLASDRWISKQVPENFVQRSKSISDFAAYSMAGLSAGSFLWGKLRGSDPLSEAGLLSAEAALNATATSYLLKEALRRQRPYEGTQQGTFFQGGSSFPSEHAAVAWSVASVWAHEYPGPLSQTLAYGLASAVMLTRVTGKQHFASDALVGSLLGWYFGREAYRAHHDVDLGGAAWGSVFERDVAQHFSREGRRPADMGSSYVPIDSWVYPAFDRLIALGVVREAYAGLRPWTRLECARLLEEMAERSGNSSDDSEVEKTHAALAEEFAIELRRLEGERNQGMSVDSVYARTTAIAGTPLRDGYHFGQSIVNDYGRPYAQGFNAIAGFTAHAEEGPLSVSMQGEYQHAPAAASDPLAVLQATAEADSTLPLTNAQAEINRLQLIQGAVGLTFNGIEFSFGQQSLWLGPGQAGPFLFSNNSQPMTMLRVDSVAPYEVPLLSQLLGPVRSEFFMGRLSGQAWEFSPPQLFGPNLPSQPFLHGTKFSFHPTANFEFGMGFTAQFGGTGNPFTWGNFLKTFYSHSGTSSVNPAKRLSEFDFTYRLPGLRNWVEIYSDFMVIDEYSPIGSTRPAMNPGIYFPRIPKLHKLDLRLEGVTDDLNIPAHFGPGAFYFDTRYRSGYTNNGNLIGSWVGRQGRAEQGWLTYRFSPRKSLQVGYRHNSMDKTFLAGGELRDLTLKADWMLGCGLSVSTAIQQEDWHFPAVFPSPRSDVTASFQVTFFPGRMRDRRN